MNKVHTCCAHQQTLMLKHTHELGATQHTVWVPFINVFGTHRHRIKVHLCVRIDVFVWLAVRLAPCNTSHAEVRE